MAELENVRKSKKSVELNISRYEEIAVVNERVTAGYVTLKQLTEQLKSAEAQIIECADYLDKIREDYIKADEYKTNVDNQYSELVSIWEIQCRIFTMRVRLPVMMKRDRLILMNLSLR